MAEITQKDVAASAGVDVSTVSRALDPDKSHLVRAETVALVRQAAEKLGYRVDRVAGALRRGATGTVGVVVPDLSDTFYALLISGVSHVLSPHLVAPVVVESNYEHSELARQIDHLLSRRVDVIIAAGARFADRALIESTNRERPTILAVSGIPGCPVPQVVHGDRVGGRLAADHLIDLGHVRIAELRGPADIRHFDARHQGFRERCEESGVEVIEFARPANAPTSREGELLTRELFSGSEGTRPSAIFAHDDMLALGALSALKDEGLIVPRDISLVGYNDLPTMLHSNPALTTIHYPVADVGKTLGSLAFNLIRGLDSQAPPMNLAPQIRIRQSTAPPRQGLA